jgi:hypothetical protein
MDFETSPRGLFSLLKPWGVDPRGLPPPGGFQEGRGAGFTG